MNNLNQYISEKLQIGSKTKVNKYNYHPKTKNELKDLIKQRINDEGNEVDLNDIDVSQITDMSYLFYHNFTFNGDISKWNVSNVTDMGRMFGSSQFDGDISNWNVSNVKYMTMMFYNSKFSGKNGNIDKWNVSNDTDIRCIFDKCPLEQNPPVWYKNN